MAYRSRKHNYAKKYIDNLFYKLNNSCQVPLKKIVTEDIDNYKLSLIKTREITIKEEIEISKNDTSKDDKTFEDYKNPKYIKTFKEDKTSEDDTTFEGDINPKNIKTLKEDTTSEEDKTFEYYNNPNDIKTFKDDKTSEDDTTFEGDKTFEDDTTFEGDKTFEDDKTFEGDKTFEDDITFEDDKTFEDDITFEGDKTVEDDKTSKNIKTSKDDKTDEPAIKKQKLGSDERDALKLVLSREGETHKFKSQFKSSLKPNYAIASTSTEEVPIIIDSDESDNFENNSNINENQLIWVIDVQKMMDENNYIRWIKMTGFDLKPYDQTNGMKKSAVAKLSISTSKVNVVKRSLKSKKYKEEHLIKIEKLYKKYFNKSVQDTIVIIANVVNIISLSNKHHKSRMNGSLKKRTEAEKLKERCDANRLHGRHKKILEAMLKSHFTDVVKTFGRLDFVPSFQMFFLSILTVLRVLDEPKFKKGRIFKNLVLLLWNSLKSSEYNDSKVFSIFRSNTFRPECINLISLIEDSRDVDPGVVDRMSLFFISTVSSREYFQAVIDAVTCDFNEDLGLLMDHAIFQWRANSMFRDPVDSSTVQHSNANLPVTSTVIQSPVNSDGIIQHFFIAKNPDGTYQQIPVINGKKSQTIGNTAVESSIITSQPLNNFYQSFSSSLQNGTHEPSTSKVMPENKCFVVAPTISHGPLVKVSSSLPGTSTSIPATTTFVAFKASNQNKQFVANGTIFAAEDGTFLLGKKQYQLVKRPCQMRTIVNSTNTSANPPPIAVTRCFAKNCNSPATIMCSTCTSVKYCTHMCQEIDWYDSHINDCERMLNEKTHS